MAGDKKYRGVVVPMVTPFTKAGDIDIPAAKKVTEHVVAGGALPFVLGTTGEAASMSEQGRAEFVDAVVKQTAGRGLAYAGIAGNCFKTTVEAAKKYHDLGIDAVVAHLPSYYPLTPDNMLRFYEDLAEAVPGALVIYNITITTHMSIPLDVIEKLSHHPKIVGLKDSQKDEQRFEQALKLWANRSDFSHFTGTAVLSTMALLNGSDGIVPSTGNFTPDLYKQLYDAGVAGDEAKAQELQDLTNKLGRIYQKDRVLSQSLPALKVIMNEFGLCSEAVLPPLYKVSDAERADIKKQLAEAGISKK